jgi:hypothetical protein
MVVGAEIVTTEVTAMSNAEFFEAHARAGRVCLVGGPDVIEKAIRRSQRRMTEDRSWSRWGHAFLFQGRRVDGHHWVLESDIDIHRERAQLGVQENRIDKYHRDEEYTSIAILDFGVTEEQTRRMIAEGLDLLARRTQYSLRELFAAYFKLKRPEKRAAKNPLARERAMFCSAFVQHLYLTVGIDFADDVDTKLTAPEDIARTRVPHNAWMLTR